MRVEWHDNDKQHHLVITNSLNHLDHIELKEIVDELRRLAEPYEVDKENDDECESRVPSRSTDEGPGTKNCGCGNPSVRIINCLEPSEYLTFLESEEGRNAIY